MGINLIGRKIIVLHYKEETILEVESVLGVDEIATKGFVLNKEVEKGLQCVIIGNVESSSISDLEINTNIQILIYPRTIVKIINEPFLFTSLRFLRKILLFLEEKLTTRKVSFFYF